MSESRPGKLFQLWPTLPLLYPLSQVRGISSIRQLPEWLLWGLACAAVLGVASSVVTTNPLASLLLTLLRYGWIAVMLIAGFRLGHVHVLQRLSLGLTVVYLTAIATTLWSGRGFNTRLDHPFFMPTSLGLAAAVGVLIAFYLPWRQAWWRWTFALLAGATLILTGSRTSSIALVLGLAISIPRKGALLWLGAAVGACVLFLISPLAQGFEFRRILNLTMLDRTEVWLNTLDVIRLQPWSGVGAYQLGNILQPSMESCNLFTSLSFLNYETAGCPALVRQLGNPWIIAHNLLLQELGEVGLIGLTGTLLLLGACAWTLWQTRHPLFRAVLILAVVGNVTDNVTLVPSPFFAEFFFSVVGLAAAEYSRQHTSVSSVTKRWGPPALAVGALALLALPFWVYWHPPQRSLASISRVVAPKAVRIQDPYHVLVFVQDPQKAGGRLILRLCNPYCRTGASSPLSENQPEHAQWLTLPREWALRDTDEIAVDLLAPAATYDAHRPLDEHRWKVLHAR